MNFTRSHILRKGQITIKASNNQNDDDDDDVDDGVPYYDRL